MTGIPMQPGDSIEFDITFDVKSSTIIDASKVADSIKKTFSANPAFDPTQVRYSSSHANANSITSFPGEVERMEELVKDLKAQVAAREQDLEAAKQIIIELTDEQSTSDDVDDAVTRLSLRLKAAEDKRSKSTWDKILDGSIQPYSPYDYISEPRWTLSNDTKMTDVTIS